MIRFVRTLCAYALLSALLACNAPTATPIALPTAAPGKIARSESPTPRTAQSPTLRPTPKNATAAPTTGPAPTTEPAASQTDDTGAVPTTEPTDEPTAAPPTAQPVEQPTEPAAATAQDDFFGVNTNGEILYNDKARALAILGGVQTVRISAEWDGIERKQGEYNWDGTDGVFKTLLSNNLAPLVMILDNPKWVASSQCGPVDDLPSFDRFVRALVGRYPKIRYWALYNEPDNTHPGGGCFGGGDLNNNGKPDVEDYAGMLQIAWRAIHQTNPNAFLISGAVAFDNFDTATAPPGYPGGGKGGTFNYHFLEQLFGYMQANPAPAGEKYFDMLAFNFYGIYGPYWEKQAGGVGVGAKANKLYSLMSNAGISAPLVVSETGSNSKTVGDQEQSEFAVKTLTRALANGVAHAVWWTFQDVEDSKPAPVSTWKFGLIDQDQQPKPSYNAYQTVSHQLTGATFTGPLQVEGGEGYLFSQGDSNKAVVWSVSDQPIAVTFSGRALQVTDMFGGGRVVQDNADDDHDKSDGRIALQVDKKPVYIQLVNP